MIPTYVEDGRPCQIVTVAELLPGDEILGWQAEPFTLGAVREVRSLLRQSFGPTPRVVHEIVMADGRVFETRDSTEYRRIAERES